VSFHRAIDAACDGCSNTQLINPIAGTLLTAHPRVMETVNAHFEGVKPLFDQVSVGIVNPTVQS
jgi:hypothetical protein